MTTAIWAIGGEDFWVANWGVPIAPAQKQTTKKKPCGLEL